jgi:predicted dithiol-disulfide oxidoreductase (DUF899 family)
MRYADSAKKLAGYRREIAALRGKMRKTLAATEPEPVADYAFATPRGPAKLSDLFDGKRELFVIHNMGSSCPHCTLWADGFNGVYHHLADRAAFAVSSPDAPEVQQSFAAGRGWRFPMVSHQGNSFAADMGYRAKGGGCLPGVSVFQRKRGKIVRVSDTGFSPGDDFCTVWHVLDLLPAGADGWGPKFGYG